MKRPTSSLPNNSRHFFHHSITSIIHNWFCRDERVQSSIVNRDDKRSYIKRRETEVQIVQSCFLVVIQEVWLENSCDWNILCTVDLNTGSDDLKRQRILKTRFQLGTSLIPLSFSEKGVIKGIQTSVFNPNGQRNLFISLKKMSLNIEMSPNNEFLLGVTWFRLSTSKNWPDSHRVTCSDWPYFGR